MSNSVVSHLRSAPKADFVVALVGNPNTGKTTLFNRLTGSRQKVGNYPGVTVEKREGYMSIGDYSLTLVDLPGAYSLSAVAEDERITIEFLSGRLAKHRQPDLLIYILDATNLSRNLYLASQLADANIPMVFVLNMCDEAHEQGIDIDEKQLSSKLGAPVVRMVASKGAGLSELVDCIRSILGNDLQSAPRMERAPWPNEISAHLRAFSDKLQELLGLELTELEIQRLLFDDFSDLANHLTGYLAPDITADRSQTSSKLSSLLPQLKEEISGYRNKISASCLTSTSHIEPLIRYEWIGNRLCSVVQQNNDERSSRTMMIDSILTHRVWGLLVFLSLMLVVFQSIYTFANPFMDSIDSFFGAVSDTIEPMLASMPILQSLVVNGVIAGVGGVVIFLPQILILFFFIALLEDSGYMSRAAFMMDKVFGWSGLTGKSFVPLLSSYACAIPGVMAARTIDNSRVRLITILTAPLMSCSARLPVYILLIGAFVEPTWGAGWAGISLFAMHFLGLALAVPIAWVLNRTLGGNSPEPFVMEMPPYRLPSVRNVLWRMYDKGKSFLMQAGTIILCMSILIWALSYFPHNDVNLTEAQNQSLSMLGEESGMLSENQLAARQLESSYLGQLGKFLQPVFAPAGFDWKITVGIIASFPAREVIISTLAIVYSLGSDVDENSSSLAEAMKNSHWPDGSPVFTPLVALALMVFFALCLQCGATVGIVAKETNWKWAVFTFCYMSVLAWVSAVVVYQVGSLI